MSPSEDELREKLTREQFEVTQLGGTERAFSHPYYENKESGMYHCVCCEAPLFSSQSKYESGSGWPSFWAPGTDANVKTKTDTSHGMVRTEARCGTCNAHLGHVFPDGPAPTGMRYCINGAALNFQPSQE